MVTVISTTGVCVGGRVLWEGERRTLQRGQKCSITDLGGDYDMGDTSKNSLDCTFKIHALHPLCVCYTSIKKKIVNSALLKVLGTSGN